MNRGLKILIVDDDHRMVHTLADILTLSGHEAVQAESPVDALDLLQSQTFDCVLTDVRMPNMDGVAFHKVLRSQQPGLPVILMTAYSSDEMIHQGLEEGIVGVLEKPLNISHLLAFFSSLAKNRTIAIVDDDPDFCSTLGDILRKRGFVVSQISDPIEEVQSITSQSQVVLLDLKLNSLSGLDVLLDIRAQRPDLPVLIVTAYRDEMKETIDLALKNKAFTCLYKPLEVSELVGILQKIQLSRLRTAISEAETN